MSTWILGIAYHVGLKSLRNSAHRTTDLADVNSFHHSDVRQAITPRPQRDIRDWLAVGTRSPA